MGPISGSPAPAANSLDGLLALVADPKAYQAKLSELSAQIEAAKVARGEVDQARMDLQTQQTALNKGNAEAKAHLDLIVAREKELAEDTKRLAADRKAFEKDRAAAAAADAKVEVLHAAAKERSTKLETTQATLDAKQAELEAALQATVNEKAKAAAERDNLDAEYAALADWRDAMKVTLPILNKLLKR